MDCVSRRLALPQARLIHRSERLGGKVFAFPDIIDLKDYVIKKQAHLKLSFQVNTWSVMKERITLIMTAE